MIHRSLQLDVAAIDFRKTLQAICFVNGDPTCRVQYGLLERATHTPDGPGSIRANWGTSNGKTAAGENQICQVRVQTWGPGGDWLIDRAGRLLGTDDDVSTFDPTHRVIRRVWSQNHGLRISATQTLWHDLAWLILQQRVATQSAAKQWRAMVRAWGEPAPGPVDLLLPPTAELIARKSYFDFHPFGIERQRADTLRVTAREVGRLDNVVTMDSKSAARRLEHMPGIGPWTSNYICATTLGDPDAVVTGDYGLPSTVSWALAGEPRADDDRMIELLEPFAGHRWRVVRLLMASGIKAPRRAPKRRTLDIRSL